MQLSQKELHKGPAGARVVQQAGAGRPSITPAGRANFFVRARVAAWCKRLLSSSPTCLALVQYATSCHFAACVEELSLPSSLPPPPAGLGWVGAGVKGEASLRVWAPRGVAITTHDALVPDFARDLERPGFSSLLPDGGAAGKAGKAVGGASAGGGAGGGSSKRGASKKTKR